MISDILKSSLFQLADVAHGSACPLCYSMVGKVTEEQPDYLVLIWRQLFYALSQSLIVQPVLKVRHKMLFGLLLTFGNVNVLAPAGNRRIVDLLEPLLALFVVSPVGIQMLTLYCLPFVCVVKRFDGFVFLRGMTVPELLQRRR